MHDDDDDNFHVFFSYYGEINESMMLTIFLLENFGPSDSCKTQTHKGITLHIRDGMSFFYSLLRFTIYLFFPFYIILKAAGIEQRLGKH